MVFWQRKARLVRARGLDDAASIEHDMPDELLLAVCRQLPRQDLLNLRLAHRLFTGPASEEVRHRLRILYIHPNTTSLRQAAAICDCPFFSQGIEEVILLGSFPKRETSRFNYEATGGISPIRAASLYSPWPTMWPRSKGIIGEQRAVTTETKLTEMLCNLPKLTALAFSTGVRVPGLNQTRAAVIESFSKRQLGSPYDSSAVKKDVDILFHLLHSRNFKSLRIGSTMPGLPIPTLSSAGTIHSMVKRKLSHLQKPLSHLSALELDVDNDWFNITVEGTIEWSSYCYGLLQLSSGNLESLKINISGNNMHKSVKSADQMNPIGRFGFGTISLPRLKKLEITRRPDPRHKRPQRPAVQMFPKPEDGILAFLIQHADGLESLKLSNILFLGSEPTSSLVVIRAVLQLFSTKPNLRYLKYFVTAFGHHEGCKSTFQPQASDICRHGCGEYFNIPQGVLTLAEFEELAEDLGVKMDRKRHGWDFAKWIKGISSESE